MSHPVSWLFVYIRETRLGGNNIGKRNMASVFDKDFDTLDSGRMNPRYRSFWRINKTLLVFKLYYFFVFGGRACIRPFLPVFFRHIGMSDAQAGILFGLRPIAELIGSPLCGGLADKYRKHRFVMMALFIASNALFFSLVFVSPSDHSDSSLKTTSYVNSSQSNSSIEEHLRNGSGACKDSFTEFTPLQNCSILKILYAPRMTKDRNTIFVVVGVIYFLSSFLGGSNSLADAATVKYLAAIGKGGDYGKQRLWGAVGWGSFAVISGFGIDESAKHLNQDRFLLAFCANLLFCFGAVLAMFKLPLQYLEGRSKPQIFKNLWTILSDCRIVTFLLAILVMGTCMGTIDACLFWFLEDLNGSHLLMGLTLAMTSIAEAPVMFFSGQLIKYLGHHGVLYLTLICYAIRYLCYSFIPNAWYVLAIEPLHGVTFGAMWAATASYSGVISPEGVASTVMAIVSATHFSLGRLIAGFAGGVIYSRYGPRILFRGLAITSVMTCLLFALSQKLLKKKAEAKYSHFQNETHSGTKGVLDMEMESVELDSGDENIDDVDN